MEQMHRRDTFKPVLPSDFSPQNKSEVLESIILFKEKRYGKIKERNFVDGNKQIKIISKEEPAIPIAILESELITSVINAHEENMWKGLKYPTLSSKLKSRIKKTKSQ